jgi:hypothetical protein
MSTRELVLILIVGFASALRLYSVGSNAFGLAGDGTGQLVAVPYNISSKAVFPNFYASKISIGLYSNHLLTRDGSFYGWVCLKKKILIDRVQIHTAKWVMVLQVREVYLNNKTHVDRNNINTLQPESIWKSDKTCFRNSWNTRVSNFYRWSFVCLGQ